MPNLEELIKIREEAIKKQEQVLEVIEKYIKEFSITYYQEYINKNLSIDAKKHPMSDLTIAFDDEKIIRGDSFIQGKAFFNWARELTDNNIDNDVLFEYVRLEDDEDNNIIAVQAIDANEENENFLFIRPSYIKELAEQDNLVFEITEPYYNDGFTTRIYTVSAMIPKLELDKHKVLMKKN